MAVLTEQIATSLQQQSTQVHSSRRSSKILTKTVEPELCLKAGGVSDGSVLCAETMFVCLCVCACVCFHRYCVAAGRLPLKH